MHALKGPVREKKRNQGDVLSMSFPTTENVTSQNRKRQLALDGISHAPYTLSVVRPPATDARTFPVPAGV